MGCCAGLAAVVREANRDDRSGDLFGKLKADVRVTRQTRKRSAAAALRILLVTRRRFCQKRDLLVEHKNRGPPSWGVLCARIRRRRNRYATRLWRRAVRHFWDSATTDKAGRRRCRRVPLSITNQFRVSVPKGGRRRKLMLLCEQTLQMHEQYLRQRRYQANRGCAPASSNF